jgi:hypothetical protein
MRRLVLLFGLFALALLAGCVSVEHIPLAPGAADALRGRQAALASREQPDFAAMTAARAAIGGLIGAAVMAEGGRRVVEVNNIQDPAHAIAQAIAAELRDTHQLRLAASAISVDSDDVAKVAKENSGGDLLLDVRTISWGYSYFPTTWNRYRVFYSARLRLVDLKSAKVIAEGFCSRMPEETPDAPTGDELLANGAAVVKRELKTAADTCIEHFRGATFALAAKAPSVSAASPAPAAAAAPAPAAPSSPLVASNAGVEIMFWESMRHSTNPADFRAYLEQYPQGKFVALARNRLAALAPAVGAAPGAAALAPSTAPKSSGRLPRQGDTWTYQLTEPKRVDGPKQRSYTVKVSAASPSAISEEYAIEGDVSGRWTHDGSRDVIPVGRPVFAPYLLAFTDLPSAGGLGRVQIAQGACGSAYLCQASGRVVRRESIKVAAGTFDAVRVEVDHSWRPVTISGPQGANSFGSRKITVWYAAAAKRAVRFSSRAVAGDFAPIDTDFDLELVSYQLQ